MLLLSLTCATLGKPNLFPRGAAHARACTIKLNAEERAAARAQRLNQAAQTTIPIVPQPGIPGVPQPGIPGVLQPGIPDSFGSVGPTGNRDQGVPGMPNAAADPTLEQPSPPRTPEEARRRLELMGAKVWQPEGDLSWAALAGTMELQLQVEEALILPLQYPEAFAAVRQGTRELCTAADRAVALLFYGPPGTGKTSAARIAAAQARLPLVYAPLEAMTSKWFGQAEKQIGLLFDHCGRLGRCILFLDEVRDLPRLSGGLQTLHHLCLHAPMGCVSHSRATLGLRAAEVK